jgi:hypothetical protein
VWVAAEHSDARSKLGATQGNHMLANVDADLLTVMDMSVHEDPLDQVIAILIARNVDERDAWSIWVSSGDDSEVAIKKLDTTNLEALLNNLGGVLIDAVTVGVDKDVVDDATLIGWRAMLTEMLDAPIAELTMRNEIYAVDHFFDGRTLLFLDAILEDVLNYQTSSLTKSDLVPHVSERFVNFEHDLRRLTRPAKLKKLLPNVTSIAVDHSIRNATEQLADHVSFVVLWNRVESLLNNMTAECIHAEGQDVAMYGISDGDDLLRCAMLKATLNEEVAEAVYHKRICLINDGGDNLELLLRSSSLQFLLQENGGLLIVAADNLVHNVLPIAGDSLVKEATVVHGLEWSNVARARDWTGHILEKLSV